MTRPIKLIIIGTLARPEPPDSICLVYDAFHRITARCFMQLKQYDQALKHANEANIRESNLATHFLSFLIQLHVPDDEKGTTTVRWCCPCTLNSFFVQLRQSSLHSALVTISI